MQNYNEITIMGMKKASKTWTIAANTRFSTTLTQLLPFN
jgi:hypothetical protein